MRKAVPGKASSTRLSVSQKGGGGGGGRKGALVESPENLQQVRCDAGPRRWLSPQLGRLGIKGADANRLAWGLETQISLLLFLLPSFQPSLPFIHILWLCDWNATVFTSLMRPEYCTSFPCGITAACRSRRAPPPIAFPAFFFQSLTLPGPWLLSVPYSPRHSAMFRISLRKKPCSVNSSHSLQQL